MSFNLNDTKIKIQTLFATSIINGYSKAPVPVVISSHGVGKSDIIAQIANEIGANFCTVDISTVNAGEIGGIPVQESNNGETKFRYLKYWVFDEIAEIEQQYIEKLYAEGFTVYGKNLHADKNNLIYDDEVIYTSIKNAYKKDVFDNIPTDMQFQLIYVTKEIKVTVCFFDELGAANSLVRNELMPVMLGKHVQEYLIPWFVMQVGATNPDDSMFKDGNSGYDTQAATKAQFDRRIYLQCYPTQTEWVEYMTSRTKTTWANGKKETVRKYSDEYIINMSSMEDFGVDKHRIDNINDILNDNVSRRSITQAIDILESEDQLVKYSKDIYGEIDSEKISDILNELLVAKTGTSFATIWNRGMNNIHTLVLPNDVLCENMSDITVSKFKASTTLSKISLIKLCLKKLSEMPEATKCKLSDAFDANGMFNEKCIEPKVLAYLKNVVKLINISGGNNAADPSLISSVELLPELDKAGNGCIKRFLVIRCGFGQNKKDLSNLNNL